MILCSCKMNEYLSTTLNKLKSKDYTSLNIVIGNESCDLDSAVSSLVYATFHSWHDEKLRKIQNDNCITISMLDVDRDDFPLKTEVAFCLRECGIVEKNLIFRDDIDLEHLVTSRQTIITLVDHHVLSKTLDFLTPYVTEIVDHRPLDQQQWKYNENVKSLVKIVGSCCTLVAQKIRESEFGNEFFNTHPICADLLHSVILLDTVNFSKEVNKATPLDEDIIIYLENILKLEDYQYERETKMDRLLKARSDVTSLTSSQLLRKDLKILQDVFVPSFPILVKEFLQKPQALEAVTEVLTLRHCNIAVLLGMDLNEGLKRDAAVISPTCPERGNKLAKYLQEWSNPPLQLVPESEVCTYFKQMNLAASRKQYMPALNDFLLNYKE